MMNSSVISLLVLLIANGVFGQSVPVFISGENPAGLKWEKVENMSDEFTGDSVDLRKWQIEPIENSFTWEGRPPGLFQAENVWVKDGDLRVKVGVLDEPYTGVEGSYTYCGGIVRSIQTGEKGWYYECRMKANATKCHPRSGC